MFLTRKDLGYKTNAAAIEVQGRKIYNDELYERFFQGYGLNQTYIT